MQEDNFQDRDEEFEWEDDDPDLDDCHMMPSGLCLLAGSEWCDWKCPRNRSFHAKARMFEEE